MGNNNKKISKSTIVFIVLALLAILFIVQTVFASKTYQEGIAAFEQQDWQQAMNHFSSYKQSIIYAMDHKDTDEYIEVAQIMTVIEKLQDDNNYEELVDQYKAIHFNHSSFYISMNIDQMEYDNYNAWVDHLLEAKDYEKALEAYEQIEETYRNNKKFKFETSFETIYGDLYHDWTVYLRENHQYEEAIEKYTLLAESFPKSEHSQTVETDLQDTVLEWANDLIDNNEIHQAFDQLRYIQETWPSSEIAEETKQQYFQIGLQTAISLHEKEDYQTEYETLELIIATFPDEEGVDEANQQLQLAYQVCSDQCLENDQYLAALHSLEAYRSTIEDEELIKEINEKIEIANEAIVASPGAENQIMMEIIAHAYCTREIDVPSIVNQLPDDATKIILCDDSVEGINPDFLATSLSELKYVVGLEHSTKDIETCEYTNGKVITRYQDFVVLKIFDVKTGERINSQNILGEVPEECPWKYDPKKPISDFKGAPITTATINGWIRGKLNP